MTVNQLTDAAKILKEWLGDGAKPCPHAQDRANVCRRGAEGGKCPHNHLGAWSFSAIAAEAIRTYAEAKAQIALSVEGENELGTCAICKCNLALKVHVPFRHIYDHTSDATFARFPTWCWLARELKDHLK